MSRYASTAIKGSRAGHQAHESVEEEPKEPAPRKAVAYRCEKGCEFAVTLAAEAVPPTGWNCRCGGLARLEGAPEGAVIEAPGYNAGGAQPKGSAGKGEGMAPWGQLMKRRTRKELDRLLAERMAQVRQSEWAR